MGIIIQSLVVSTLATLAMTIFSYIISWLYKNNFKEPVLLNLMLERSNLIKTSIWRAHITGWLIHFFVGLIFVIIFKILTYVFVINLSVLTGFLFGMFAGFTGVGFWHMLFSFHHDPPSINRKIFYLQLIVAHIIFGIVMILLLRNY